MCLEIWIMGIAVSNVLSEYSLGSIFRVSARKIPPVDFWRF